MEKILLLQGANMSFLGRRQPEIYGTTTAAELDAMLQEHAKSNAYRLEIFYTHIEGEAIGQLSQPPSMPTAISRWPGARPIST